ncbi:hypothetical protein HYY74_03585 [Candidatus Woesearchaeota archaeon]|nr:hypothetical protein [Candidatus Woesearchaeota archaeon]
MAQYQSISEKDLSSVFKVERKNEKLVLKYPSGRNTIQFADPFVFDEDVGALAGLMPDGSLIRDLRRIYFCQKKEYAKIILFGSLLKRLFSPSNRIFIRQGKGAFDVYINSQTLAMFFYKVLNIPKSDEQMDVPGWVFNSPDSVKISYLRQAFAMEGTILKRLYEIRFITKDYDFAVSIQRLLLQLGISSVVKERMGGTHRTLQYRISIYGKQNFSLFRKIGFDIPFHKERFNQLLVKHKILP